MMTFTSIKIILLNNDTYKTIANNVESILFKEKNSKFIGYAFPIQSEDEVKSHINRLKKEHHTANHVCYAYQIGTETTRYRVNDDGEPSNSAGMPIYGQIQSFSITNVLVAVVRYFGGVKLGVGGLITSYKTSAHLTLEAANIIEKTIDIRYQITFEYKSMNKIMRLIKEKNLELISQNMGNNCDIILSTRKANEEMIESTLKNIFDITYKKL